jgi:hypothetical protein
MPESFPFAPQVSELGGSLQTQRLRTPEREAEVTGSASRSEVTSMASALNIAISRS